MVPDRQRLSTEERANLVAFLDGELPEGESRAIATKLTQSMTARREVDILQKTWEMLDLLPRPKASEDFTARTLISADGLGAPRKAVPPAAALALRRATQGLIWAILAAALFGVGFALTLRVWPNPSARLTRDLSIAESLDEYRDAKTFEFVREIDRSPEFD